VKPTKSAMHEARRPWPAQEPSWLVRRLRLGVGHASTVRLDPSTLGVVENEAPATRAACSRSQALGQAETWTFWLAIRAGLLADRLAGEDVEAKAVAAGCQSGDNPVEEGPGSP
jgi:hypothetical protein